jgi:PEP-CTERM motif
MNMKFPIAALCSAVLATAALPAMAVGIFDATGDYVTGFTGSKAGDLDVTSAVVTYDPLADTFTFNASFAANIGATPSGFYVWGINRGAGTAGFAANGVGGVLFDEVLLFQQNGSITINPLVNPGPINLPAGTATITGSTISAVIAGSNLASTGFAKTAYTWNLWPRDGTLAGFAAISDFAPDNSNAAVTVAAVPEPSTWALFAAGLAAVVWSAGKRRRA